MANGKTSLNGYILSRRTFGIHLRDARRRCGERYNQNSFAAAVGITARSLRRIERGDRVPSDQTLGLILKAGGVDEAQAARLRALRARLVADQAGIGTVARDQIQLGRLERRLVVAATMVLRQCGCCVTDRIQRRLSAAFAQVLQVVLVDEQQTAE